MGFLKKLSLYQKKRSFGDRAKRFLKEHQALSRKHGCEFQAYMGEKDKNGTKRPLIAIIDIEEYLKEREVTKEGLIKPIKPAKPSKVPGNDIDTGKF